MLNEKTLNYAIHIAVENGNEEFVQLLVAFKVDVNVQDYSKSEYAQNEWVKVPPYIE